MKEHTTGQSSIVSAWASNRSNQNSNVRDIHRRWDLTNNKIWAANRALAINNHLFAQSNTWTREHSTWTTVASKIDTQGGADRPDVTSLTGFIVAYRRITISEDVCEYECRGQNKTNKKWTFNDRLTHLRSAPVAIAFWSHHKCARISQFCLKSPFARANEPIKKLIFHFVTWFAISCACWNRIKCLAERLLFRYRILIRTNIIRFQSICILWSVCRVECRNRDRKNGMKTKMLIGIDAQAYDRRVSPHLIGN